MRFHLFVLLSAILSVAITFATIAQPASASTPNAPPSPAEPPSGKPSDKPATEASATETPANQAAETLTLAAKAESILARYCARCHRGDGSRTGYAFNVLDAGSLTGRSVMGRKPSDEPAENSEPVVVARRPEDSDLFHAMYDNRMPPRNQASLPRPSAAEIETVKLWIAAGAPDFPKPTPRPFISVEDMLHSIKKHFDSIAPKDREFVRYFTLTHLHNDPTVDARHLRMVRAGLAKALNSLSWAPQLVRPAAVDVDQTVYSVDLRQLGWNRDYRHDHWRAIIKEYPYGLRFVEHPTRTLKRLDEDLRHLANGDTRLLHLRADWFVSVALKPKLYHALLYDLTLPKLKQRAVAMPVVNSDPLNPLGMTDKDLEAELNVDVIENIFSLAPVARRAAFTESGISGQNRMIERHPLDNRRYYWKSYDFLASNRQANLSEFPLGPKDPKNKQFDDAAFQHDGGEIIFSLPNGLQGYMLATASGARLNAGPIEIVGDGLKTAGNQLIVNGLSCVVCHREGMVEPPDDETLGVAKAIGGERKDHILKLYPPQAEMQTLIDTDRKAFLAAQRDCIAEYLLQGDDQTADLLRLPEPVGETSRRFLLESLAIETVAAELFEPDVQRLKILLEGNPALIKAGVGALRREGGRIKRDAWESEAAFSLMQEVARELGYTPLDF